MRATDREATAVNSTAQLEVSHRGHVAVLTLKRPGFGNRLTEQMAGEVRSALERARTNPEIRACVLAGDGNVFCLGGDYQGAGTTTAGRTGYARALIDMDRGMARLGKPLIAAVNGDAHAGGFSLVIACDLAVVAADATLGLPEAANGLFPFIATAIVKDSLPKKVLFDLIYNARLMTACEAREMHVVNEVVPRAVVLDRAIELAERASRYNPEIVKLGRDLYYDLRGIKPEDALDASQIALLAALAEKDRGDSN
jgi:enoyl-CoA hydratase/carnithine racemase